MDAGGAAWPAMSSPLLSWQIKLKLACKALHKPPQTPAASSATQETPQGLAQDTTAGPSRPKLTNQDTHLGLRLALTPCIPQAP